MSFYVRIAKMGPKRGGLRLTFLGTGTSQGVPVIGCDCAVCCSADARDARLRTSAMVEVADKRFIIDAGPDFRQQMLRAGVSHIAAIFLTHKHKDHIGGLDDVSVSEVNSELLRGVVNVRTDSLFAIEIVEYDYDVSAVEHRLDDVNVAIRSNSFDFRVIDSVNNYGSSLVAGYYLTLRRIVIRRVLYTANVVVVSSYSCLCEILSIKGFFDSNHIALDLDLVSRGGKNNRQRCNEKNESEN